jgi:putative tryptophan/tyrosine transport system substrate-binding protein
VDYGVDSLTRSHSLNDAAAYGPRLEGEFVKRREFIALIGGAAAAWPLAARAQESERMWLIGLLSAYAENDAGVPEYVATFLQALQQLGWNQARNLQVEVRWAAGDRDRMQRYATELVELNLDLILAQSTPAVAALRRATRTIPVVFVNVSDPVGSGFVESLARPGGNITGFSNFEPSMGGKWVGLLKEIAPHVTRIALMSNPETAPQARAYLPGIETAARSLGMHPTATPVHDSAEIERAMAALGRDPSAGLVLLSDIFTLANRDLIVRLADQYRVPAIYPFREFSKSGGLLFYGMDLVVQWRQAAPYIDRIFKGEKPGALPVQAPTKFELIINAKTAKALGLIIPDKLLALADEVIE